MATRSPAKQSKPKPTTALEDTPAFEPVRIGRKKRTPDDRVVLFYLEDDQGEEVPYSIPRKVAPALVFEFVRLSREEGDVVATYRVLQRLLGPEAYTAFEQSEDIDADAMEQISAAVMHHLTGKVEEAGKAG